MRWSGQGRRWRSLSQVLASWPTADGRGLGYVKAYLQLRHSDQFDAD